MPSQNKQYEYEKVWAQGFIDKLNSEQGSDYQISEKKSEKLNWADVDVEVISLSGQFPNLYLQLTVDNLFDSIIKYENFKIPVFTLDNILESIKNKVNKYKKNRKLFSEITLLIQGTLSESSRSFVLTKEIFIECSKFEFKNIYYISAPCLSGSGGMDHFEDWFIEKLK